MTLHDTFETVEHVSYHRFKLIRRIFGTTKDKRYIQPVIYCLFLQGKAHPDMRSMDDEYCTASE